MFIIDLMFVNPELQTQDSATYGWWQLRIGGHPPGGWNKKFY